MRFMMIGVVALGALVLPGCFRYHAARGEAGAASEIATDAWVMPGDVTGLQALLETPSEFEVWKIDRELIKKHYPEVTEAQLDELEPTLWIHVTGGRVQNGGLIRFWRHEGEEFKHTMSLSRGLFSVKLQDFDSDGAYLSATRLPYLQGKKRFEGGEYRLRLIESLLKVRGIIRTGVEREWFLRDGIQIGLPDDTSNGDLHGTIVHIASFYENEYEHRLLERLEGYGWAVGHIESDVVIDGPLAVEQLEQRDQRRTYRDELMAQDPYFEQAEQALMGDGLSSTEMEAYQEKYQNVSKQAAERFPLLGDGLEIHPGMDLQAHGRMLAGVIDQRIAEHAYASQALIEESDRINPELADKPIVVFGFSAGALVAPAVVARLHEAYPDRAIALIMLGGGGDVLSASLQSVFEEAKINFTPRDGPKPTQSQLDELVTHYRAASKLDPLTLAPVIRDLPTLHLYAARDTVVPTSSARAFNEAHGHVDRLVHPLNHETLFYFAAGEAGRIKSWLREHGMMD